MTDTKQDLNFKDKEALLSSFRKLSHDLRTPLLSAAMRASFLKKTLPILLETYAIAKQAKLDVPELSDKKIKELTESPDNILEMTKEANELIDTFLKEFGLP